MIEEAVEEVTTRIRQKINDSDVDQKYPKELLIKLIQFRDTKYAQRSE